MKFTLKVRSAKSVDKPLKVFSTLTECVVFIEALVVIPFPKDSYQHILPNVSFT